MIFLRWAASWPSSCNIWVGSSGKKRVCFILFSSPRSDIGCLFAFLKAVSILSTALVRWVMADSSPNWKQCSFVSPMPWQHGHIGVSCHPWECKDLYVGFQPWISLTIIALLCTFLLFCTLANSCSSIISWVQDFLWLGVVLVVWWRSPTVQQEAPQECYLANL